MYIKILYRMFGPIAVSILSIIFVPITCLASSNGYVFKGPLEVPAKQLTNPETHPLEGVAVAGKRIVAVGLRGIVVYSDDQGRHWSQARVPVSSDLTAVDFVTPEQGWAVGHEGVVLHTVDGGRTWQVQLNGNEIVQLLIHFYTNWLDDLKGLEGKDLFEHLNRRLGNAKWLSQHKPALGLLNVWFESKSVGYVVGEAGVFLKTTNGGKTWEPWGWRLQIPHFYHLYGLKGTANTVYIAGEAGTFARYDQKTGLFPMISTPYDGSYFGVAADGSLVLLYGLNGHAFISRDGGHSWEAPPLDAQSSFVGGFIQHGQIALASKTGKVFFSKNNGKAFMTYQAPQSGTVYSLVIFRGKKLVLVGSLGVSVVQLDIPATTTIPDVQN